MRFFAKEFMNDPNNECYAHFYIQSCFVYILFTLRFCFLDVNFHFQLKLFTSLSPNIFVNNTQWCVWQNTEYEYLKAVLMTATKLSTTMNCNEIGCLNFDIQSLVTVIECYLFQFSF